MHSNLESDPNAIPVRDQDRSTFGRILHDFVSSEPNLIATALVDAEGECVDYAGALSPFDVRVTAAHLQIDLRHTNDRLAQHLGTIDFLRVCTSGRSYVIRTLAEGYALVMVVFGSPFSVSDRAMAQAEVELSREAGWNPRTPDRWSKVRVDTGTETDQRPKRIQVSGRWVDMQVLGTVVGLAYGEVGYRVRLATGAELTLVRETIGQWYADDFAG